MKSTTQVLSFLPSIFSSIFIPEGIIGGSHGVTQPVRTDTKISRNSICPCGSKKKYKHCCLQKTFTY